jgi:large subunit ribosomal protein L4
MKAPIYNQQGEKMGETELPTEIFDVPFNPDLVHQVVVSQMANRRRVIAHTKGRGAVSGGGRKPWAQKGLGRARQGSIRSPQWRKGGVVFGPRNTRVFKKTIPEKMKRKALFSALSEKARENEVILLEDLPQEYSKTKVFHSLLRKLPVQEKTLLVAYPEKAKFLARVARNIPFAHPVPVKGLNALDLLSTKFFLTTKTGLEELKNAFL